MKVVIIKHNSGSQYLFSVPGDKELKKGDTVIVSNRRGKTFGVCASDSFEITKRPLEKVLEKQKAKAIVKNVVGRVCVEKWEVVE